MSVQSKAFLEVGVDLASAWIFKRIGQRKGKPLADAQSDSKPRNPFESLQKPENPGVINNRPGKEPNVDLPKDGPPPGFQQKQLPTAKSAPAESPPPGPAVKPTPDTSGKTLDDQRANDKLKSLSDNGEGKPYGTPRTGTTQNNAPPEASNVNTHAAGTELTTKLDNGSVSAGNVAPSKNGAGKLADSIIERDPNWTHTWKPGRSGAAHNADTLRTNMGLKPTAMEDGLDAHHIVQSTNNKTPEFQQARDLLLEHQIDVNSSANGVALRTTKPYTPLPADPKLRMHKGGELHTNEGGRRTYKRLKDAADRAGSDWAARRQALLNELDKLRGEIIDGVFP